jgi:hypothetical protein
MLIDSAEYRLWLNGLMPAYRPSRGEIFCAAGGIYDG